MQKEININILALDYGTRTGFCFGRQVDNLEIGTWALATSKEITGFGKTRMARRRDPRISRFVTKLRQFPTADIVVFEDVQFSSTVYACQLWASLRTVAWLDYPDNVIFEAVPVGTLKLFATGAGNATKESMLAAALTNPQFSSINFDAIDDNGVDALWLWAWAKNYLTNKPA